MTTWYKEGVLGDLNPGIRRAKRRIEKIFAKHNDDLKITSKRDGNHGPGSCHPEGDAIDFKYGKPSEKEIIDTAGSNCDVVFHKTHVHVEFDPH